MLNAEPVVIVHVFASAWLPRLGNTNNQMLAATNKGLSFVCLESNKLCLHSKGKHLPSLQMIICMCLNPVDYTTKSCLLRLLLCVSGDTGTSGLEASLSQHSSLETHVSFIHKHISTSSRRKNVILLFPVQLTKTQEHTDHDSQKEAHSIDPKNQLGTCSYMHSNGRLTLTRSGERVHSTNGDPVPTLTL